MLLSYPAASFLVSTPLSLSPHSVPSLSPFNPTPHLHPSPPPLTLPLPSPPPLTSTPHPPTSLTLPLPSPPPLTSTPHPPTSLTSTPMSVQVQDAMNHFVKAFQRHKTAMYRLPELTTPKVISQVCNEGWQRVWQRARSCGR